MQWLIGVDEAGRGPLAGPVAVGAALVAPDFDWSCIDGVADSKQLSEHTREALFEMARELKRSGRLDYQVTLIGAGTIDRIGIAPAVRRGITRTIAALEYRHALTPDGVLVKLDGALRAPSRFTYQETIVGGDGKERCIGLASILAKVTRDRYMRRVAARYPLYQFETHKGYSTKAHRERIAEYGISDMHRRTFCTQLTR